MKRLLAVAGLSAALAVVGCSQSEDRQDTAAAGPTGLEAREAAKTGATEAAPITAVAPEPAAAAEDAPSFAVVYPGGSPKAEAMTAQGPAGPGGRIEFTTEASPDAVVAFYRQRAEAAGLRSINTLSRDEVRGYAAGDGANGRGKLLNVVATPLEDGQTDVLLMWSNGD